MTEHEEIHKVLDAAGIEDKTDDGLYLLVVDRIRLLIDERDILKEQVTGQAELELLAQVAAGAQRYACAEHIRPHKPGPSTRSLVLNAPCPDMAVVLTKWYAEKGKVTNER